MEKKKNTIIKNNLNYLQLIISNKCLSRYYDNEISYNNNIIPKFNDSVNSWSFYTKCAIGQHDRQRIV